MKKSTIIFIVSIVLIGLFLSEINEATGEAIRFFRKTTSTTKSVTQPLSSKCSSQITTGRDYNSWWRPHKFKSIKLSQCTLKANPDNTYDVKCGPGQMARKTACINHQTLHKSLPSIGREHILCQSKGVIIKVSRPTEDTLKLTYKHMWCRDCRGRYKRARYKKRGQIFKTETCTVTIPTPTCTDTTWIPSPSTVCSGDTLTQTSNCGNTKTTTGTKTCLSDQICQNGQCIIRECTDSDSGEKYYVKGEIKGYDTNDEYFTDFDYCELNGQETSSCDGKGCVLREYRCDYAGAPGSKIVPIRGTYNCLDDCQDGACISSCLYACCSDDDCNDNDPYTKDECFLQGTSRARCTFVHSYMRQNYFDYCWEYDCNALPPYPKLATPSIPEIAEVKYNLKGVGNVNAVVVLLYAHEPLPNEKLNILKADETDIRSFKYTSRWFKDNALKYGINLNLNIEFSSQQHKIPEEYIIRNTQECWIKDKELSKYIINNLPQYSNYDIIALFYYHSDDFSCSNHVMGTEGKKTFILFSNQIEENNFHPSFEEGTVYSRAFAHESSHLFGARDKYTCLYPSSSNCQYAKQNGKGCIIESDNPNELGKDIMCHRVPEYSDIFKRWHFFHPNLNELIIIEATAKEYGWFDFDGDGILEINDPCPFIKNNIC